MSHPRHLPWPALCLLLATACGQPTLKPHYPVNQPAAIASIAQRLQAAPARSVPSVVVGVSTQREVYVYDLLAERLRWKRALAPESAPIPLTNAVVVGEAARVLVLDLASGEPTHTIESDGLHVVGADGDGELTSIALSNLNPVEPRSRLVILRGPTRVADLSIARPIGGPAVAGGMVFLPHNRVHLSVLEAGGREIARLVVQEDVVSQAITVGRDVYFGEAGVQRFGPTLRSFRADPGVALPGNPSFLRAITAPPPPVTSAQHRVFLSFEIDPSEGADVRLMNDSLYLTFYSQTYALDAAGRGARWVHQSEADIVEARSLPAGLLLCDTRGRLTLLSSGGRPIWERETGVPTLVARAQASRGFWPGQTSVGTLEPVAEQLQSAAAASDARLVPARALATRLLSKVDTADATAALIELCSDPHAPTPVREAACGGLRGRSSGSEAVLLSLASHYDFLAETTTPPLVPLAEAAARSGDHDAVALLLEHLADPATPIEAWPALMEAVTRLADARDAPALAAFVSFHHADASELEVERALVLAVQALGRLGGERALSALRGVESSPFAEWRVRDAAIEELARHAAASVSAAPEVAGEPSEPEAPVAPSAAAPTRPVAPPSRLKTDDLREALAPHQSALTQCLRDDPSKPESLRLTVVVSGSDGRVLTVRTIPETSAACVEPIVRSVTLPVSREGRQTLSLTVWR